MTRKKTKEAGTDLLLSLVVSLVTVGFLVFAVEAFVSGDITKKTLVLLLSAMYLALLAFGYWLFPKVVSRYQKYRHSEVSFIFSRIRFSAGFAGVIFIVGLYLCYDLTDTSQMPNESPENEHVDMTAPVQD